MAYYCFNTDCNEWGEAQNIAIFATYPMPGKIEKGCKSCRGDLFYHDNWDGQREDYDYE